MRNFHLGTAIACGFWARTVAAFDPASLQFGTVTFEMIDTGFSEDLFWSFTLTNQSHYVLGGLYMEIDIFIEDRPVPIEQDWIFALTELPGGLLPSETVTVAERVHITSLMERLDLSADRLRATLTLQDVADVAGFFVLCRPHPRQLDDDYVGWVSCYDGPSPQVCAADDTAQQGSAAPASCQRPLKAQRSAKSVA